MNNCLLESNTITMQFIIINFNPTLCSQSQRSRLGKRKSLLINNE